MADPRWSPFIYPKGLHRRWVSPPQFLQYQRYKPYLRQEFAGKCVYCRKPDGLAVGTANFHVDHYRPKTGRFAHLAAVYDNLFYSCDRCNILKGRYWPTDAQLKAGRFFANPCDHVMFAHVRFDRASVTAQSSTGEFMVEALELNEDRAIKLRLAILNWIRLSLRERDEHRATLQELRARLTAASGSGEIQEATDMLNEVTALVRETENDLRLLMGGEEPLPD